MKKVLLMSLAILMIAPYAMADHIGIYTDQAGTTCTLAVIAPVSQDLFVVHTSANGATGSQFKVVENTEWTFSASHLVPLGIGDAFTDLALSYGGCIAGPMTLAVEKLNCFLFPFPGNPCQTLEIVAAPTAPAGVIAVDCNYAENVATGGIFIMNPTVDCPSCEQPTATKESTWGKVKSLYR